MSIIYLLKHWMNGKNSLLIFALACIFLCYGYEMANYTLSIDEEVYAAGMASYRGALEQGRCGMALLIKLFPLVPGVPVVPTLLFGLGLIISGMLVVSFFKDKITEKYIFMGLFCTSPIWPHIAEFSTISWAFSMALIASSLGIYILLNRWRHSIVTSALCLAFAVSVYQALLIYYVVLGLMLILFFEQYKETSSIQFIGRLILSCLLALILYKTITITCNYIYGCKNDYLDAYMNLSKPKKMPFKMIQSGSLVKAVGYLLGYDWIFLSGPLCTGILFFLSFFHLYFPSNFLKIPSHFSLFFWQ